MVVKIISGFKNIFKVVTSLYENRLRLGVSGYLQLFFYSFLFCYPSYSHAGPTGGNIVGGSGSIDQSGLTTTINQNTSSMAIDWNSYNLSSDEIVNYIQPSSTSISLNRILGSNASEIHGQINANGQIVLVNPNGIFFGQNASINVGGLIASGLDISTTDFMNGDYIFNEVLGTDGTVINSGLINASLGGNITLLGKQVVNEGVISAKLGSVNLAAGKAAVLTFDQQGLLGVQVTEAILQDELGLDPAVLNSGEINAEGGRVLLTGSVSQDVFSQAVNSGAIEQATSVVVHEDGSFTLGGGSDVLNTGSIDVSSDDQATDAGQIVLLGENVTSSGIINADGIGGGGNIELHANNTTLVTGYSQVSTRSLENGKGGKIKLLGDKVGLLDQAVVDASGQNGGGEVLIGGDYRGENQQVRNAAATYVEDNVEINASGLSEGDGGRIIIWGNESAKVFGDILAHGGELSGDGGFVETSANVVELDLDVNVGASNGEVGTWLIDPLNITIQSTCVGLCTPTVEDNTDPTYDSIFTANTVDSVLTTGTLLGSFTDGANVLVETTAGGSAEPTGGNITLASELDLDDALSTGTYSLTLKADHDININERILDSDTDTLNSLNLTLIANSNGVDGGDVNVGANLSTGGGSFSASGDNINVTVDGAIATQNNSVTLTANTNGSIIVDGGINTGGGLFTAEGAAASTGVDYAGSGPITTSGGAVNIDVSGDVAITGDVTTTGGNFTVTDANTFANSDTGDILTGAGAVSITTSGDTVGDGTGVGIHLGRIETTATLSATSNGGSITQTASTSDELRIAGLTTLSSSSNITLNNADNRFGIVATTTAVDLTLVDDTGGANLGATSITGDLNVTANGGGNDIIQSGILTVGGTSLFQADSDNIILQNPNNDFTGAVSSNSVDSFLIRDKNDLKVGNITVTDTSTTDPALSLTADGAGSITQEIGTSIDMANNGGFAELTATGNSITLNENNDFYAVLLDANDVQLTELGTIRLFTSTITNDLTIVAGSVSNNNTDAIQDIGNATISVDGLTTLTARNSTIPGNQININLDSTNANYASVNILDADDVTIVDNTDGLAIQGTVQGALDITANGTVTGGDVITNPGALIVAGASTTVTVLSGQSIDLGNAANSFTNDPSFETSNGGNIANLSVTDITDITIQDALNVTGNLTVTGNNVTFNTTTVGNDFNVTATSATGLIDQNSGINVSGVSTLISNSTGGTIALDDSGNNFNGAVSLTAQTATVRDTDSITLDDSSVGGGGLTVTAENGNIKQLGTGTGLDITGVAQFNSTNGHIDLANNNNDFKSDVGIATNGTDTTVTTVQVTDANDITLVNVNVGASSAEFIANATQVNLNGDVTTAGGDATFNGSLLLYTDAIALTPTLNLISTGTGTVNFNGALDGSNEREQSLSITAGDVNFIDTVGTTRLGDLTIDATGAVTALATITANSLNVNSSDSFSSGAIDTTGIDGGNVTVNAITAISTGAINSSGGTGNGGDITLNVDNGSGSNTVTLNGDINTSGLATAGTATVNLNGTGSGIFSIDYTGVLTSDLTVNSLAGDTDTINAANITNIWNVDGDSTGTLNTKIRFNGFENITGGTAGDTFNFTTITSSIDGLVDGNSGTDTDIINLAAVATTVQLGATSGVSGNNILEVNNVEQINADATTNNTLNGVIAGSNWFINGSGSGSVGGSAVTVTPVEGVTLFTNFSTLYGGTGADTFNIVSNDISTNLLTINGGASASPAEFDTLTGPDIDATWTIDSNNGGTVVDTDGGADLATNLNIRFDDVENLQGGSGDDTFSIVGGFDVDGAVDGGGHINGDIFDLSNLAVVTFNIAGGLNGRTGFEVVNGNWDGVNGDSTIIGENDINSWLIDGDNSGTVDGLTFTNFNNLTGGTGTDTFTFTNSGTIDGLIDGNGNSGVGVEKIDLTAMSTTVTVQLNSASNLNNNNILEIANIEQVDANAGLNNELGAITGTNLWQINGVYSGSVNGVDFNGFAILTGGSGQDTLVNNQGIDINWTMTGLESGSYEDTNTLTSDLISFSNFNAITGGSGSNDVLLSSSTEANNIWNISADFTGDLNSSLSFTNINEFNGNTTSDTFYIADAVVNAVIDGGAGSGVDNVELIAEAGTDLNTNIWNVTGAGGGTVKGGILFSSIENLVGNDGVDQFVLATDQFAGNMSGGAGIDSLTGNLGDNSWTIDSDDGGSVSADTTPFISATYDAVENLIGNSGNDAFTVSATGNLSGTIDGGSGIDTLDLSAKTNSITVKLGAVSTTPTVLEYFNSDNLETVTAPTPVNGSVSNTVIGADVDQLWIIDGINSGAVGDVVLLDTGIPVGDTEGITKFSNFDNVQGGSNDDSFRFINLGEIITSLVGGDHINGDTIDLSLQSVVNITISSTGSTGFDEIEGFRGNDTNSTLIASNADNTWTITGNNDGTVLNNDTGNSFTFQDFNILNGGDQDDEFVILSGGSVEDLTNGNAASGIFGGSGNDSLILNLDGTDNGGIFQFDGGTGTDIITFQDDLVTGGFDLAVFTPDTIDGSVTYSFENRDINDNLVNSYNITYVDSETVNDNVTANKLVINGSALNDDITLGATDFTVVSNSLPATNFTTVDYSNKNDLDIIGAGGVDSIEFTGDINLGANNLLLSAETIGNSGNRLITANSLTLDSVQETTETLRTDINTLTISNSATVLPNQISIDEQDSIAIAGLQLTGGLDLIANNNITQSSSISSNAALQLTSRTGNILLDDPANALSGALSLTAANNVILDNTVVTDLASVQSASLTVNSTTSINDSGDVITGVATLDAGTGSIQLDSVGNDFDTLSIISAENVFITDVDEIQLADISMGTTAGTGTFELNSVGVSQLAGTSFTQVQPSAGLGGQVTFNAGAASISLNQNNQFTGSVSLNNTGNYDVVIRDIDTLNFATSTLGSGDFTVNATSGISQLTGTAITQDLAAGAVNLNAGAGAIELAQSNDFTGTVSSSNTGVNAVAITDINSIDLGATNVGGSFDIIAADGISQSAALTVAGDASFTANAGQIIQLDNNSNNFQQNVSFSGTGGLLLDVLIANNAALDLGDISVVRHLGVSADGDVNNSGALNVGGVAWIDASGNAITLDNSTNDFNEIVFVNARDVSIVDANDVIIGSTAANIAPYTGSTDSNISGSLSVTSLSGSITDNDESNLFVGGVSTFSAGAGIGDVILDASTNNFSTVNIADARNVTLVDANSIDIRSSSINGNLDVTAVSNITNANGSLVVQGTSTLTAGNNQSISLDNAANQLSGTLTFAASSGSLLDVVLSNAVDTEIAALNVTNDLTIVSDGEITQLGGFDVGSTVTLTATQDITLDSNDNNIRNIAVLNGNNVTINNGGNALAVNRINATGIVGITSGNFTQNGNIRSQGSISLDSTGSIFMDSATNTTSTTGNVRYTSGSGNANLALLSAANGTVAVNTSGQIIDNNSGATNFIGDTLELRSTTGIGNGAGNELESQVAVMDVINSGSGDIRFIQSGAVEFVALQNAQSSGLISVVSDSDLNFNPGSVVANRDTGTLFMVTTGGSFLGVGPFDLSNADITANTATFIGLNGTFGTPTRPIILDVPRDGSVLIDSQTVSAGFFPETPDDLITTGIDISALGAISAIAGEQLIEIESLGEIDPAIFTGLRRYSHEDVAIRMPRDQLYEDELEEDEEG